ncbi:DUF2306 domain-containing protein [Brevibacillus reuszeri]|uniref:DUF2306 domain-containing protein n=1 Tax=Brevibacillus reuszeri TaxID=54915 RepID=UPI0028985362|nr:DUF2306 domain-containing protein [Brevibacillus reuszeri]
MKSLRKSLYITVSILSIGWAFHMLANYFIVDPGATKLLQHKVLGENFVHTLWLVLLRLHIISACIGLITGPLGLSDKILRKRPALHRLNGKVYVLSILFSSVVTIYLAKDATGGTFTTAGFLLLNGLWIFATLYAWWTIRLKQIVKHRIWMMRSYALTLANTSLHFIQIALMKLFDVDFVSSYMIAVWAAWIINIVIVELITKQKRVLSDL